MLSDLLRWLTRMRSFAIQFLHSDRQDQLARFEGLTHAITTLQQSIDQIPDRLLHDADGGSHPRSASQEAQASAPPPTQDGEAPPAESSGATGKQQQQRASRGDGDAEMHGFVELARRISGAAGGARRLGPRRMPTIAGQRLFGGPSPVDDDTRRQRWGTGAKGAAISLGVNAAKAAATGGAGAANQEVKRDAADLAFEQLKTTGAFQHMLDGKSGSDMQDPATFLISAFELLTEMRDMIHKQGERDKREREALGKRRAMTDREKAESEAKRAEISKLEQMAKERSVAEESACSQLSPGLSLTRCRSSVWRTEIAQTLSRLKENSLRMEGVLTKLAHRGDTGGEVDPAIKAEAKKLMR